MAKEYNIKAIVDKEDLKLIFECDKEKNKQCSKKHCGTCNYTTNTRYMKAKQRIATTTHNKKITDKEIIVELEQEIEQYRDTIKRLKETHNETNEKTLDKKFEITIDNEEYLIEYNSNKEINSIQINVYLIKLVNEKDRIRIAKDNEFDIINITRDKKFNYERGIY